MAKAKTEAKKPLTWWGVLFWPLTSPSHFAVTVVAYGAYELLAYLQPALVAQAWNKVGEFVINITFGVAWLAIIGFVIILLLKKLFGGEKK